LARSPFRIGVTIVAVCAIVGLSMLPAAHAHTASTGQTFIHSHAVADPVDHQDVLDHGDHGAGPTLVRGFIAAAVQSIAPPATLDASPVAAPEARLVAHPRDVDRQAIHGPPRRIRSLRAPPA
jgi:hypothetical protein